jgi:hypothetical protein
MKQYVLTETFFKRLTKRNNGFLICNYCQKPIVPRQRVVTKTNKNGTKRYHKECYEKTLIA